MKWLWKKLKSKKQKALLVFLLCFAIIAGLVTYVVRCVDPSIITANQAAIRSLTVTALNNAVVQTVGANAYTDLIEVTKNNSGDIVLMQVNTQNVNALNAALISSGQTNLSDMGSSGINIPIGSFTGITIFNGIGPKVNLKMVPIGNVTCTFVSQFVSAGINQTHHKILLNMTATVSVLLPITSRTVTTTQQILIAESIILGAVPETYLNTDNLTNALNLIPE